MVTDAFLSKKFNKDCFFTRCSELLFSFMCIVLVFLVVTINQYGSAQNIAIDEGKNLVVMISGELDTSPVYGAGIVFGVSKNRAYIVTANHVVRRGESELENIIVEFNQLPGEVFEAKLLKPLGSTFDIAVLNISLDELNLSEADFPFELLSGGDINSANTIFTIGHGNGRTWNTLQEPANLMQALGGLMDVQSSSISQGDSGGGVFSESGRLLGMIVQDAPPALRAIDSKTLFDTLESYSYVISRPGPVAEPPISEPNDPTTTPIQSPPEIASSGNESVEIKTNVAIASSQYSSSEGASMMIDSNFNSRWISYNQDAAEVSFEILLSKIETVSKIGIYYNDSVYSRITKATVTFLDGSKQVITLRGLIGWEYVELSPVQTDTIAIDSIEIVTGEGSSNLGISEFKVFGP